MKTPLNQQTIVITGASSGVGRAAALGFAKNGSKLVLAARNSHALNELVDECKEMGATALAVVTDVSDNKDVLALAEAAEKFGGRIDVWINNAGVLAAGEFDRTPVEVHEHVIRTNLMGYVFGAHAVLPYFKKQGRGILINNISIGGFMPVPFAAGYSASKFGLRGFFEALKGELYDWPGIHICDLFPAFLDTPGVQHAANYTGKVLKPAPPVYDPARVAMAMISLAQKPKKSTFVGSLSGILRLAHNLFPGVTRRALSGAMSWYFAKADPIENTSGNIFNPLKFGVSTHGGWGLPGKPKAHRKYIAGGLLLIAASSVLLIVKNQNDS